VSAVILLRSKSGASAIRLLEDGLPQTEIAHRLNVCRSTVVRWVAQYRHNGKDALRRAGRAGRPAMLGQADRQRLEQLLLRGPEALGYETPLWTCPRMAHLIEREFGIRYSEGHVWKILVGLRWSPQRPVGRARERNEAQIRTWRKKTWPALKKKPAGRAALSSSSTKAD